MLIIILIDLLAVAILCSLAVSKGLESALPFFTFVMVLLPIESRITFGFFELTTHRLMIVVLLFLYLFVGSNKEQSDPKLVLPLKTLIFVHVTWCLLSTLYSIDPVMSLKKLISVAFEYYMLYFVYCKTITNVQTIQKILMAMVLALVVCSVFGTYEAYNGWNVVALLPMAAHRFGTGDLTSGYEDMDRGIRVMSTFDHPILFGAALAMTILIALYLLSVIEKGWRKTFLWMGLMLMFFNIYKTTSRGPWLDVILGYVLLFLFGRSRTRKPLIILGILSLAAMIIRPGVWQTVEGIFENTFNLNTSTGSSLEYRPAMQRAVYHNLMEHPSRAVLGYGLETFYTVGIVGDFLGEPHIFLSADNAWAEATEETGFVGLFILFLLLSRPLVIAWRDFRKFDGPDGDLSLLFFISFLIFYIQMFSVGMYSWGQNGYILWILIAACMAFHGVRRTEFSSPEIADNEAVVCLSKTEKTAAAL